MASWSRVRWSTVCLTSDNSCRIWADEVDGGAGGRSVVTSADVMSHACSRPKFGSIGGRGGDSWLIQGISPRATALSASACHWAALPTAFFMPSAPARAISVAATALPNASPAAISLAAALPDHSATLRCSAARWVISATAAGKRTFSISTVTPDSTASSEGYAGKSPTGINARMPPSIRAGDRRWNWYFQYHAVLSASYWATAT